MINISGYKNSEWKDYTFELTFRWGVTATCKKSADLKTIKGTEIILTKLMIAVNETDNATSPLANLVNTFDVTPPGAAAIIITPNANSNGVLNILISTKATIGRIIN